MIDAHEIIKQFVHKWNRNETLKKSSKDEVKQVEKKLGIHLPDIYRHLVEQYGDLYTPDLLDAIVDNDLNFPDVQNFAPPAQALSDTDAYVQAGMPAGYFGFASDCMGNFFCFKLEDCKQTREDCSIWFFDHDFVEIWELSNSFINWIKSYNEIKI